VDGIFWRRLATVAILTVDLGAHAASGTPVETAAQLEAALAKLQRLRVRQIPPEAYRRDGYSARYDTMQIYRVAPAQRALPLVGHFTAGDFLSPEFRFPTSWLYAPLHIDASGEQYVLLDRRILLKLLHVINHLMRQGHDADSLHLFAHRTDRINRYLHDYRMRTFGRTSLAKRSYHLLGRAVDLLVGDLNRDGRIDVKDHGLLVCAVNAVERRHRSLRGGLGLYAQSIHTDIREQRVRWCGKGGNRSALCSGRRLICE
jgi:hypothetical protein